MIAVNASFRLLPTCDAIYIGDHRAVRQYHAEARKLAPQAELWTCTGLAAEQYHLHQIRTMLTAGLGLEGIATDLGNSGFHAINFAFLAGARHIILLGFDMKLGPGGQKHWHGDHPAPLMQWMQFDDWKHKAIKLAADLETHGARVVNCTPGSAMTAFPIVDLKEELCHVRST